METIKSRMLSFSTKTVVMYSDEVKYVRVVITRVLLSRDDIFVGKLGLTQIS